MFENKLIHRVHISRFIVSWVRAGGKLTHRGLGYEDFDEWLHTLTVNGSRLSFDEVSDILEIARTGKMELEDSAKEFIQRKRF